MRFLPDGSYIIIYIIIYIEKIHQNKNMLFGLDLKLRLGIRVSSVVKVRVNDFMTLWLCQLVTTLKSCLQNKIHEENANSF